MSIRFLLLLNSLLIPCSSIWAAVTDQDVVRRPVISNQFQTLQLQTHPQLPLNSPTNETIRLPDLPEPAQNEASLRPTQSGGLQGSVHFKGALDGTRFSIFRDFTNGDDAPLDLDFATQQIPKTTLGWLVSTTSNQTETVMNLGWRFGKNQQLLLSAAQLRESVDLDTYGRQNAHLNQLSGGLNYRYFINKKWLTGIELTGYASGSPSQFLPASAQTDDALHIAGSSLYGMQLGVETSPLPDSKLKIGIGSERLSYATLSGIEPESHVNTSIKWSQILLPTVKYNATVESNGIERSLSTELDLNLRDGHQLGVKLARTKWSDGQTTDNAIQLAYTYQFGKKFTSFQPQASKKPWSSSLVHEVLDRPDYLPSSPLSKPESSIN